MKLHKASVNLQAIDQASWGNYYWPIWVVFMLVTLLGPELYALFTNVANTQSYWVWKTLGIDTGDTPSPWTTWTWSHFLAFGFTVVLATWLIGHFFFRLWH